MKGNYEAIVHPLRPLCDESSKISTLGSLPSVKTREYESFYDHPQNRLWKPTEKLLDVDLNMSIEERGKFLLEHNTAMYDSIYKCDVIGSSDSSIKNIMLSSLKEIVDCTDIEHAFCNGTASYECYEKYHTKNSRADCMKLPSTSPTNTRYRLDDLVDEWKIILEYL